MEYEKNLRGQNKYTEKEILDKIVNYMRIKRDIKTRLKYINEQEWMKPASTAQEHKRNRDKFIYWIEEEIDLENLYMTLKSHKKLFSELDEMLE